jgi:hypothetical protein
MDGHDEQDCPRPDLRRKTIPSLDSGVITKVDNNRHNKFMCNTHMDGIN